MRPVMKGCGTRASYARGCHCDACTKASRNYHRRLRGDWDRQAAQLAIGPPPPGAWINNAACRGLDPDLFFPDRGKPTDEIRATCAACAVQTECLAWALHNRQPHGFYGGLSPKERAELLR